MVKSDRKLVNIVDHVWISVNNISGNTNFLLNACMQIIVIFVLI